MDDETRQLRIWPLVVALAVLFLPFAYSDEILTALLGEFPPLTLYLIVDVSLLAAVAVMMWLAARTTPLGWWRWVWFGAGSLLSLALNAVVVAMPVDVREGLGFGIATSVAYVVSLAVIGAAVVGSPRLAGYRPLLPLLIGTFAAYLGGEYWDVLRPISEAASTGPDKEPRPTVDHQYFAQASQVIPLLLIAIGFEARYFVRQVKRAGGLAVTIVTVGLLCLSEALVLTTLPSRIPTTEPMRWYEYWAFTISVAACFIGLVLLFLAILANAAGVSGDDSPAQEHPRRPRPAPPPGTGRAIRRVRPVSQPGHREPTTGA